MKNHMYYKVFLIFVFYVFASSLSITEILGNDIKITQPSAWVVQNKYETPSRIHETEGGYLYLLMEYQENIPEQTMFARHTVKLLNLTGVQNFSEIIADFDPTYQQLHFHYINIIRNGETIPKLEANDIQTIQRETQMDRYLYDGTLTSFVNLKDVRENDIIDYAYSISGYNPLSNGNFGNIVQLQYPIPVNKLIIRVITSVKKPLNYKLFNSAPNPEIIKDNNHLTYSWEVAATENIVMDVNTPSWYNPFMMVQTTSFDTWSDVVNWALPLYELNQGDIATLNPVVLDTLPIEEKILQTIQWVQDEVRYLGFASGIGAYKPNKPITVMNRRYGDCKDKSLLLIAMLNKLGIEAYPVLVNTTEGKVLPNYLPDYKVFNHVVVCIHQHGKDYFVDPTLSYLGGGLKNMYFPVYEYGLLIQKGQNELIELPKPLKEEVDVVQTFHFDSIGGDISMSIETAYQNAAADRIRGAFKANTISEIQRNYLDFYSYAFPEIELTETIEMIDNGRNESNVVILKENYIIYDNWVKDEDSEILVFDFVPLLTNSFVEYYRSPRRTMPYFMGNPQKLTKKAIFIMPENWPAEENSIVINGNGYNYIHNFYSKSNKIFATYEYELEHDYLEAGDVRQFQKDHEKIHQNLSYQLTYHGSSSNSNANSIALILTIVTILIGIGLALKVYKYYDPLPLGTESEHNIGGWMILPLIGLFLSPFIIAFQLINEGYYNQELWSMTNVYEAQKKFFLNLLIGSELIANVLFVIFCILLIILLIKRRSSLPKLISIYLLVRVFYSGLLFYAYNSVAPELITEEIKHHTITEIVKLSASAIIWVSYFNLSKRVKYTFTKRYSNKPLIE